jgi:PAS domain S-box-containing protein
MPKSPQPPAQARQPIPSTETSAEPGTIAPPAEATADALISLLERLPDAVLVLDREWRIIFANDQARRISRLSPDDLNDRTHWELYPETAGTSVERVYREVAETGVSAHFEHYHAPFDVYLDVHVLAMPEGIALHYRDISDRKRPEAVRDRAAEKLEQAFSAVTDSVVCVDRNWNCTFANSAALTLLKTDTLLGANLWTRFPANQEEPYASNYRRTMKERVPSDFEAYYPEPLETWFRISAHPFEDGIIIFASDIGGRKRAEAVRDATARRLNQVLEATSDGIVSLDRDWRYSFVNRRAAEMLGRNDLQGRLVWEEFPYLVDSEFSLHMRRTMEERVPTEFEAWYPEPLENWLSLQIRPSEDGIVIFFRDITERRHSEQVFRQQRDLITFVQQASRTAFWSFHIATGTLSFDIGSYPVFGHDLSQLTDSAAFLAIVHPDDRSRVSADTARAISSGDLVVNDFRVLDAQGKTVWLEARSQTSVVDGKPVTLGGMTIDITQRKRNEQALIEQQLETERQRAELETLYQTAPIGLALFDPVEFRYLRLNERQAEIVGLPPDDVLGKRLTEIASIPGLNEMFETVAAGTPIRNALLEGSVATRPQEHRFWAVNYFPVYSSDGSVRAITAASLEITAQKKAELALIESEKLAAVGRLATSISHEINNPLEAVTNLLYLIATDQHLPASIAGYVETAQSEVARVSQIATQTLRFHRQAIRATRVTAQELVGAVLNLYRGRRLNSGITVEASYEAQTPLLCLENDIRQVLNNLIDNAIFAMRLGGRLIIRARDATGFSPSIPEGRRGLRIVIADTGHGMSPAVMARVFEPFYTTKALNGTGLGLWISSGIIGRHNGTIRIRSSQDPQRHGTVFSLFLPHISEAEIETATPLQG